MASKSFSKFLAYFYRVLLRRLRSAHATHIRFQKWPPLPDKLSGQTVVCHMEGGLLRSSSIFPYFMLVALEAGGFFRALLLLLLCPVIACLGHEMRLRIMVVVCFCGLRKEKFKLGRTVLPKFFLEDVGMEGFEILSRSQRKVCVSAMPTVMVEGFLRGYLEVEVAVGRELKVFGGYYTGLMEKDSVASKVLSGTEKAREDDVIGFGGYPSSVVHHPLFSHCKEVYLVSEADKRKWRVLPRTEYPKPLVFHDGRIAFRPTPTSTLCMFLWIPLAFLLAFARAAIFIFLPYSFSVPLLCFTGMHSRVITSSRNHQAERRQLYISNHRTLLDPLCISAALGHHVTATTYSVSRISEMLSPIRTVRLTRNREQDKGLMKKLLREGALVVCPEGTTCREPYLIRFSPLFAEFMEKVATGWIGGNKCSSCEIANHLQGEIGKLLGFKCTSFTRRDKYLMLASNDGSI
ncbi:hypothetical protein OPV22_024959 [Ensete ventricosum]|uniref:Phospholipid/glycerol acyltransferase domain-containing protein n=1 Tax=Ensete ventricosum TaxID=4639 RepID=A0AAV8Q642_ENSVE|nr:hypothetical protein OPV22_024959 [Ensete ventricosum]